MGLTAQPVTIRRGVQMYPVFDIPLENTHDIWRKNSLVDRAVLKDEVLEWISGNGLPNDTMSNDWTCWDDWKGGTASFFFLDPQIAMLFKLTWA
jgi:hypothetical protein